MSKCDECQHGLLRVDETSPCSTCDPDDPAKSCFEKKIGRPLGRNYDKPYSLRFTPYQRDALSKLAETRGKSEQATLRELVEEAFNKVT